MSEEVKNNLQAAVENVHDAYTHAVNTGVRYDPEMETGIHADQNSVEVPSATLHHQGSDETYRDYGVTTKEPTGTYTTRSIYSNREGHYPTETTDVTVERPDGNGGTYTAQLKGENAEKAATIVANRAAKRVGDAATKRALQVIQSYNTKDTKAA